MGRKVLAAALLVILPLTTFVVFAAGDALLPHPWTKQSHGTAHTAVRLPAGIAGATTMLVPLVVVGRLTTPAAPAATSVAPPPPFIPPRA